MRLPDLPDLELLTQQQHRQLGRLAHRDLLELAQRMLCRDHQLQFIFIQQQPMQAGLARRQVADTDIQRTVEQAAFDLKPRQFVDLHHQVWLGLAYAVE
ncbi:hypothetical protein D3C86_1884330 [compost metagenome]